MKSPAYLLCVIAWTTLACAHAHPAPPRETPPSPEQIAAQLAHSGRYLEASYYYAWLYQRDALTAPDRWIPPLVSCQVRAGRLRAARTTLRRHLERRPDDAAAMRLLRTIDAVLHATETLDVTALEESRS